MGLRSYDQSPKEMYRQTYTVTNTMVAGDYASERITFGPRLAGDSVQFFREVSALVEGPILFGCQFELWLPKIAVGGQLPSDLTDADYFNTNVTPLSTAALGRWQLSAWPGAQLRMKAGAGAIPGSVTLNASGY